MTASIVALLAATGTYLLFTATAFGWRDRAPASPGRGAITPRAALRQWLAQAGLAEVALGEFLSAMARL